ncbi:unnamed protein product [Staurois parvus]|uniref:Uncharacterized protein n=1 Tax=Staurois parvus TaxID=386267 RepID=A0ABN9FBB9_9NEOB|nr:unnamed protein product [Staurois parvus]
MSIFLCSKWRSFHSALDSADLSCVDHMHSPKKKKKPLQQYTPN